MTQLVEAKLQAGRSKVRIPMVIEIFDLLNSYGQTVALGSTQPLREMCTSDISWEVKAAGA